MATKTEFRQDRGAAPGEFDPQLDCLRCGHAKAAHSLDGCLVQTGAVGRDGTQLGRRYHCSCSAPNGKD